MPRALVFLLLAATARAGPVIVETGHYRLFYDGAQADADLAGRVLEAAYSEFKSIFKAEPKRKKGEKLVVRFFAGRENWAKALVADQAVPPADAGGYYWPTTKTAYLYRQPTDYYTRALLIHESGHQFHYLARTRNRTPAADWYAEGVVEFLCEHHWNGEQLTLGILPTLNLRDYPAKALPLAKAAGFKLHEFVAGKQHAGSRPLGWALYRFLATVEDKQVRGKFTRWSRKMDGGNSPGPLFRKTFGRGKQLQAQFLTWLEGEQQPWEQIFNEWQPAGENSLRGFSKVSSACRPKGPVATLQATLVIPKEKTGWKAGILLHYLSKEDYSVALIDGGGFLDIRRRVGGRWQTIERGQGPPKPGDGAYKLMAFRRKGNVTLMIGNAGYGPWELPGKTLGLAIENGGITFHHLQWN